MGETAAETLTEIASVRDALERDISTLADRMPPKEDLVRGAAMAGGGLAAVASLVAVLAKIVAGRREERRVRHEADAHAEALTAALARRGQRIVEDDTAATASAEAGDGDGGGLLWALLAVMAGFAAAFAWVRRGRQLDDRTFEEADPADPVERDLATGGGLPTRPGGTTRSP